MTTRDDGRGLIGARLLSYYRIQAAQGIQARPARTEPASLTIAGARVSDKRQAYALAIEIMAQADIAFKGETV